MNTKLHDEINLIHEQIVLLNSKLLMTGEKIDKVQYSIDNVTANGRKGLNESIQDIHSEIRTLRNEIQDYSWLKYLKSGKLGSKIIIGAIFYLVISTVFHLLGIKQIDLFRIFSILAT